MTQLRGRRKRIFGDSAGGGNTPPSQLSSPVLAGTAPYYINTLFTRTDGTYDGTPAPTVSREYEVDRGDGMGFVSRSSAATYVADNLDQGTTIAGQMRVKEVVDNGVGPAQTFYSNVITLYNPVVAMGSGLWLDMADHTKYTETSPGSGLVALQNDKSANAYDFDMTGATSAPLTNVTTQNGFNGFNFPDDGSGHWLKCAAAGLRALLGLQNHTAWVVGAVTGNRTGQVQHRFLNGHIATLNSRWQLLILANGTTFRYSSSSGGTVVSQTVAASALPRLMRGSRNGAVGSIRHNGVSGGTVGASNVTLAEIRIGSQASGVLADSLEGDIFEVFVAPGAWAGTQEELDFEGYIKAKWNVP